jgi:carbamoylphosphate synthase small subunit
MNSQIVEALKALTDEISNLNKFLESSIDIKVAPRDTPKSIQELRAAGVEQMAIVHKEASVHFNDPVKEDEDEDEDEDLEGEDPVSLNDITTLNRHLQTNKKITGKQIQEHMKEQYETDKGVPVRRASELNGIQRVMLYKWMQQFNK